MSALLLPCSTSYDFSFNRRSAPGGDARKILTQFSNLPKLVPARMCLSHCCASVTTLIPAKSAMIKVVGVGGGRNNAVNRMIASGLKENGKWHMPSKNGIKDDDLLPKNQLKKRVFFGFFIGIIAGALLLIGGWAFTLVLAFSVLTASCEYYELLRSDGISFGTGPIPLYLSRACSIICTLMPIFTFYYGRVDVFMALGAFILAMAFLCQKGDPHFSQLSHLLFGLFYCGYLPCFWVMLRCCLSVPYSRTGNMLFFISSLRSHLQSIGLNIFQDHSYPSVGFVSTLFSISCVIVADTCAFIGGKAFGRTLLSNVSPKKTWEGAISGFGGCILTAFLLSKIFQWPKYFVSVMLFGLIIFCGSIFGDLIESLIKRNAGVKDSGSLIPGHGGILDRVDSYIFTGAISYSFVEIFLLGNSA